MNPSTCPSPPNDTSPQPNPSRASRRSDGQVAQSSRNGLCRRAALFGTLLVLHRRQPTPGLLGLLPVEAIPLDGAAGPRSRSRPPAGRGRFHCARVTAISWRRHAALKLISRLYEKHAFVPVRSVAEETGSLGPHCSATLRLGDLRGRHFGSHFIAEFDRHGERCCARDGEVEPHAGQYRDFWHSVAMFIHQAKMSLCQCVRLVPGLYDTRAAACAGSCGTPWPPQKYIDRADFASGRFPYLPTDARAALLRNCRA